MKHPSVKFVILTDEALERLKLYRRLSVESCLICLNLEEIRLCLARASSRQCLVGSLSGALALRRCEPLHRVGRSRSNVRRKFGCMLEPLFLQWMQC